MGLWLHPYALSVRVDICGVAERIQFRVENNSIESEWTTQKNDKNILSVMSSLHYETLRIV